jgi:hypothetical protein
MAAAKNQSKPANRKPAGFDPFVWARRLIALAQDELDIGRKNLAPHASISVNLSDDEIRQREAFVTAQRVTLESPDAIEAMHESITEVGLPTNRRDHQLRIALGFKPDANPTRLCVRGAGCAADGSLPVVPAQPSARRRGRPMSTPIWR